MPTTEAADWTVNRTDACGSFIGWRVASRLQGDGFARPSEDKRRYSMDTRVKHEMEAMDRVDVFGDRTDITLTPKLTGLFTTVGVTLTTLRNWGMEQVSGEQGQSAGILQRR